jgi:hypothetical protein
VSAPDELIRRIESELEDAYVSERAAQAADLGPQPELGRSRRWPLLVAAAALVLFGAVASQLLFFDSGGGDVAEASGVDVLAAAMLSTDENGLLYRGHEVGEPGVLGPGPYVVSVVTQVSRETDATITVEYVTSLVDGSVRRSETEASGIVDTIVFQNAESFDAWIGWPTDSIALLDLVLARSRTEENAAIASFHDLTEVIRSPLAPAELRSAAWLALGNLPEAGVAGLGAEVRVSVHSEDRSAEVVAVADPDSGRLLRIEDWQGSDSESSAFLTYTTLFAAPYVTDAAP